MKITPRVAGAEIQRRIPIFDFPPPPPPKGESAASAQVSAIKSLHVVMAGQGIPALRAASSR